MLSKLLHYSGIDMGSDSTKWKSIPPEQKKPYYPGYKLFDPSGLYEDEDFSKLNHHIFWHGGFGGWFQVKSEKKKFFDLGFNEKIQNRIKETIRKKDNKDIPWGWKDPRQLMTLVFYRNHLKNPRFVFIHRNPLEMILSARGRDKVELSRSLWVYSQYLSLGTYILYLRNKVGKEYPVLHISYEKILAKPAIVFQQICNFVGITFRPEICEEIISPKKNHYAEKNYAISKELEIVI